MNLLLNKQLAFRTDVLVIGGGVAGLRAAVEAKLNGADVCLVSKSPVGFGNNSAISGGGINIVGVNNSDTPEKYVEDTIYGGGKINNPNLVRIIGMNTKREYDFLRRIGVEFCERGGKPEVFLTPGFSYPRFTFVKNFFGVGLVKPLRDYAVKLGVRFVEKVMVTRLIKSGNRILGAFGVGRNGECYFFNAKTVILSAGGAGQIYLQTNNPAGMTGDGYALAYNLDIPLIDMEFVQFYPTCMFEPDLPNLILLYETFVIRDNAVLRNSAGEDILKKYGLKMKSQMTRDNVARAVMQEIKSKRGIDGKVILDLTGLPKEKFEQYKKHGPYIRGVLLPKKKEIHVSPVAHYFMGGIRINEKCETGLFGLYAAGEVAGGVHGANRISGNALTECLVFGSIAGKQAAEKAENINLESVPEDDVSQEIKRLKNLGSSTKEENLSKLILNLRQTMWNNVGIIRDKESLEDAINTIQTLKKKALNAKVNNLNDLITLLEFLNMLTVSEIISKTALLRTETRGSHYRKDYPKENEKRFRNIVVSKDIIKEEQVIRI